MKDLQAYLYDIICIEQADEMDDLDEQVRAEMKMQSGADALQALGSMNPEEGSVDRWTSETWPSPVGVGR